MWWLHLPARIEEEEIEITTVPEVVETTTVVEAVAEEDQEVAVAEVATNREVQVVPGRLPARVMEGPLQHQVLVAAVALVLVAMPVEGGNQPKRKAGVAKMRVTEETKGERRFVLELVERVVELS